MLLQRSFSNLIAIRFKSIHPHLIRFYSSSELPADLVKTITLRTCIGVYDELRRINPKRYRNAPSEGVDLTVKYVDTKKSQENYNKLIVCFHGTADSYNTFNRQILHFLPTDVRVIAINLPDFSHTRQTNFAFWHSNTEKYHFVKDFLHKLEINRIDCLIGHSLGSQACLLLSEKPDNIMINSIACISPQFLVEDFEKKFLRFSRFVLNFSSERGTWLMNKLELYKISPFKFTEMDQFYLMCCLLTDHHQPEDSFRRIKKWKESNIPGFIIFGSDERMISSYAIEAPQKLLGIEEKIFIENDDPKLVKPPTNPIESYLLKDAGHFPHFKYSRVTNQIIEYMLRNFNKFTTTKNT